MSNRQWSPGAEYAVGASVDYGDHSYVCVSALPAGSEPQFPWCRDDGWVPVYQPSFAGYRRYSAVSHNGRVFVAMDEMQPGDAPSAPNTVGSGWCPVWQPGSEYTQGQFVAVCRKAGYVESEFFRASEAIGAALPIPDMTNTNLRGWVRVWQELGMYLEREYVYHDNAYYRSPLDGILTAPMAPAVCAAAWTPLHNPSVAYLPGHFVVHHNVTYVAASAPAGGSIPAFFNQTGLSWVPLWDAKLPYRKSAYVWYQHALYCAKQSSGPQIHHPLKNTLVWQYVDTVLQPVLEFDASALAAGVGSQVTAWPNSGSIGASHNALVKVQPAIIGGVGTAKHVTVNRGNQHYFSLGSSTPISWFWPTDIATGGLTVCVVARFNAAGSDEQLIDFSDAVTGCRIGLGRLGNGNTLRAVATDSAGRTCADIQAALPAGSEGSFNILLLSLQSSTTGTACRLYINRWGGAAATGGAAVRMVNMDADCQIGRSSSGGAAALLSADIRHLCVYSHSLTGYQVGCVMRDMQLKWAMAQAWDASALYPRGSVVLDASAQYGCIVDAPAGVSPSSTPGLWMPVYRDQVAFAAGDTVFHQGVGYVAVGATMQRVPPNPVNLSGGGLVPMWMRGTAYGKGSYVSHNGALYYAVKDQDLQVEPSSPTVDLYGWVPVWAAGRPYGMNSAVVVEERAYIAVATMETSTLSPKVSNEWVEVWEEARQYPAGAAVAHNNYTYDACGGVEAGVEPKLRKLDPDGWVPRWQFGMAYTNGQFVTWNGALYRSLTASAEGVSKLAVTTPVRPNTAGAGWVPVWKAGVQYDAGVYAWHLDRLYLAASTCVNEVPAPNTTRSDQWVEVWIPARLWDAGTYVHHAGTVYRAFGDVAASMAAPVRRNSTGSGWVPVHSKSAVQLPISRGCYICSLQGALYRAGKTDAALAAAAPAPVAASSDGWVPLYAPIAYPRGAYVVDASGQLYTSLVGQTAATVTAPSDTGSQGVWRPVCRALTAAGAFLGYTFGSHISAVYGGDSIARTYVGAPRTPTSPVFASAAWVPVWAHDQKYPIGAVAVKPEDNISYKAAVSPAVGVAPLPQVTAKDAWVRIWSHGQATLLNEYVYFGGMYYRACLDTAGLPTTAPARSNLTGKGWVLVFEQGYSFPNGSIVMNPQDGLRYVLASPAASLVDYPSSPNKVGRAGWVPLWTQGGQYGIGDHVYDPDTALYYRAATADVSLGGTAPSPVNKPGKGWVALWDPAIGYAVDSMVIDDRDDTAYIAATVVEIGTTVTANILGKDGWVPVYRPVDRYMSGMYVYDIGRAAYYFAASDVEGRAPGANKVGQFGWVPLWAAGRSYMAGEYVIFSQRLYYAVPDVAPVTDGHGAYLEPDSDARWARDIIPTNMYMKDDTVVYSGVAYRTLLNQGANTMPSDTNLDPSMWLTVFSSSAAYPAKKMVLTASNTVFVSYTAPPAADLPGLPRDQQPAPRSSWAPLWVPSPAAPYQEGDMVFHGGVFFIAVSAWELGAAAPSVQKQFARGWVAVFDPANTTGYAKGSLVLHGSDMYQAMSDVGVDAVPGRSFNASLGWVPLWSSASAYSKGEYVVFNGMAYYSLAHQPASSLTPAATGNVDVWARPWNASITYGAGAVVVREGLAYSCLAQQVAGISPVPQQLTNGALSLPTAEDSLLWLPVYSKHVLYYANALAMHEGCVYIACDADPALLPLLGTAPTQGQSVLRGWVSVWTPAAGVLYAPGNYVYYAGGYYRAASTGVQGVALPVYAGITPQPLTTAVAGWVPVWLSATAYAPGNVVCGPDDGECYAACSIPQTGAAPAPNRISVDGWVRVWNAAAAYPQGEYCLYCNTVQSVDATKGSVFRAMSATAPSAAAPTSTTRVASGWVPLWKPTSMYPETQLVVGPADGLFYIAATTVSPGVLPGVHASRVAGWVPVWQEGVPFTPGDRVYVPPKAGSPDAGYYVSVTRTTAPPGMNYSGGTGWVPEWTPVLSLPKGSYFTYNGALMYADAALPPSGSVPSQAARPWDSTVAYSAGAVVVHDGVAYSCIVGQAVNNYPERASTDASSWIRLYSSRHGYTAGQLVMLGGDAYIARDASGLEVPPAETATALAGWIPLWKKFTAYYEGQFVHSNGMYFYAYTLPASNTSTGTQEAPAPTKTSASRWVPIWDPKTLYPANAVVCIADGTAYMAAGVPAAGVVPKPNTVGIIGWLPVWKANRPVPYRVGEFVAHVTVGTISSTTAYFKAVGGTALNSAPLPSTMSTAGWAPFWNSTSSYASGQVVVSPSGLVYVAATAVATNTEPAPNTAGVSGWVMVWAPPAEASDPAVAQVTPPAYPAGTICSYAASYWRALTEVLSTTEPAPCLSGGGWARILSSGQEYKAEEFLWDASLQRLLYTPAPASGSFGGWVLPWTAQFSYNAGSLVVYEGAVYSCLVQQPANGVPLAGSKDTGSWLGKFNTSVVYTPGSVVELSSVAYVAVGARATPAAAPAARPVFAVQDRDAWVPIWATADAAASRYTAGQVVYWDGQCYKASTAGSELAVAPSPINRTGRGWVPYWDVGLTYTQGELVFTDGSVMALAASDPAVGSEPGRSSACSEWVPVWSSAFVQALRPGHGDVTAFSPTGSYTKASFEARTARFYRAFVPATAGAAQPPTDPLALAPPGRQSVASPVGWVPFWQSGAAYSAGEVVAGVDDTHIYTAVSTPPPGRTPTPVTRLLAGWLQVWSHTHEYSTGVYVSHRGSAYVAASAPYVGQEPQRNLVGVALWVPVWSRGDAYAAGEYVVYNQKAYFAVQPSRSVTPDLSPKVWAGRFMANMPYAQGAVVIIEGVAHTNIAHQEPRSVPAAPGEDDISGWVRLYNPTLSYVPGDVVSFNSQPYVAVTPAPVGDQPPATFAPSDPDTPAIGWVRVWTKGDGSPREVLYSLGEYVYHHGLLYRAVASVRRTAVDAPSPASNAPVGWLQVWSPTKLYAGGVFAVGPDGYVYGSRTAPPTGQVPRPNYANSRGWLALWSCARPFSAGEYVLHANRVFYAAEQVEVSTILPLVSSRWGKDWVRTVGYAPHTCVIYDGIAYGCTFPQDANRAPFFNTRNARSWAPRYSSHVEYPPNQLVVHRERMFIAYTAMENGVAEPVWNTSAINGWVPLWQPLPADSYKPGQYVYHINVPPGEERWSVRFGSFYQLLGRNSNSEPVPSIAADLRALEQGWLRVYQRNMVYAAGDVVVDLNREVHIAATAPDVGAGLGPNRGIITSMPGATGWVPQYVRGNAYAAKELVYHREIYYYVATPVQQGAAQPRPPLRNTTATEWVPLWDAAVSYPAGSVVAGSGSQIYIAASRPDTGAPPALNITGLVGWVHAWAPPRAANGTVSDRFAAGTFVWHRNRFYKAAAAVSLDVMPCPNRVDGLAGWVQIWDNKNTYGAGEYVHHAGGLYYSLTQIGASIQSPDNSASGWARMYNDGVPYAPGSVVLWQGKAHSCVKAVAAGVAPTVSPTTFNAWVPVYSSQATYAASSLVFHLGSVYCAVDASPVVDPLANRDRPDLAGWVLVWGASLAAAPAATYASGQFVALLASQHQAGAATYFYKAFDSSGLASQPSAVLTGSPAGGWVPLWQSALVYGANSVVVTAQGGFFVAASQVNDGMAPAPTDSLRGWVPIWRSNSSRAFSVGEVVSHSPSGRYDTASLRFFKAYSNTPDLTAVAPTGSNVSGGGWIPFWSLSSTYIANAAVYGSDGRVYIAATAPVPGVAPAKPVLDIAQGWVPLWQPQDAFAAREVVARPLQPDRVVDFYIAVTAPETGATPRRNYVGEKGWAPMWTASKLYTAGEYVVYAGALYYSKAVVRAGLDVPSTNSGSWAKAWLSQTNYSAGDTVIHEGCAYSCIVRPPYGLAPVAAPTASTGWIPAYSAGVSYAPGRLVVHERRAYIAATLCAAGVAPAINTAGPALWVPVWTAGDASMKVGCFVAYTSSSNYVKPQFYFAHVNRNLTTAAPVLQATAATLLTSGFVPLWDRQATYDVDWLAYSVTDRVVYIAASKPAVGQEPVQNSAGLRAWVGVWSAGVAFAAGSYCHSGGSYYLASTSVGTGAEKPTAPASSLRVWVPVWKKELDYAQGNFVAAELGGAVYIAATSVPKAIQPAQNLMGPTLWVPVWAASAAYPASAHVYYYDERLGAIGVYYKAATSVAPGARPARNFDGAIGWLPLWSAQLAYRATELVLSEGIMYAAGTDVSSGQPPPPTNSAAWVGPWQAASAYPKGSCVTYNGQLYTCAIDLPRYQNPPASQTQTIYGWVPMFCPGRTAMYSKSQLVAYKGRVFCAVGTDLRERPAANVRALRAWAPLWQPGDVYGVGVFVAYSSDGIYSPPPLYIAASDDGLLSVTAPPASSSSAAGWVPVFDAAKRYAQGSVVSDEGGCIYYAVTQPSSQAQLSNATSAAGWLQVWSHGASYPHGIYVAHKTYKGTFAYAALRDAVPSFASPSDSSVWAKQWSASTRYSDGAGVWHIGQLFIKTKSSSSNLPPSVEEWAPVWSASRSYPADSHVYHNGTMYIATQQTQGAEPSRDTPYTEGVSWVQKYSGDALYDPGQSVALLAGLVFQAREPQPRHAPPLLASYNADSWLPCWADLTLYNKNALVVHWLPGMNRPTVFQAMNDVFGVEPALQNELVKDWLPVWDAHSAYEPGTHVVYEGVAYSSTLPKPAGSYRPGDVREQGLKEIGDWLPAWQPNISYAIGDTVIHMGEVFIAFVPTPTTLPFLNSQEWVAFWRKGVQYTAGSVVMYDAVQVSLSSTMFLANVTDPALGLVPPERVNKTGRGWVPVWRPPSTPFQPGEYVYDKGHFFGTMQMQAVGSPAPSDSSTNDSTGWIQAWVPRTPMFARSDADIGQGINGLLGAEPTGAASTARESAVGLGDSVANLETTSYVDPYLDAPSIIPIPTWSPATAAGAVYTQGTLVFHQGVTYVAYTDVPASVEPPPAVQSNVSGWIPVWTDTLVYGVGMIVYHASTPQGSRLFIARTFDRLDAHPVDVNLSGLGWVPLYSTSRAALTVGEYLYVHPRRAYYGVYPGLDLRSLLQPVYSDTGGVPSAWNPPLQGETPRLYTQGTVVFYQGEMYIAANDTSTSPLGTSNTTGKDWVPVWRSGVQYQPYNHVYHAPNTLISIYTARLYTQFVARGVTDTVTPPAPDNRSGFGWIDRWTAGRAQAPTSFTFHKGLFYMLMVRAGNDTLSKVEPQGNTTLQGWIPLWVASGLVIARGGVVYDTETSDPYILVSDNTTAPLSSTGDWQNAWNLTRTYLQGSAVTHRGERFVAFSDLTGVEPSMAAITATGWVPTFRQAAYYAPMTLVVRNGALYGTSTAQVPLNDMSNFTKLWAALWQGGQAYAPMSEVYFEGVRYATPLGQALPSATFPYTLWHRVWFPHLAFKLGAVVFFNGTLYAYVNTDNIADAYPGRTPLAWVPVFTLGKSYERGTTVYSQRYVYMLTSNVAPSEPLSGSNSVVIWSQTSGSSLSQAVKRMMDVNLIPTYKKMHSIMSIAKGVLSVRARNLPVSELFLCISFVKEMNELKTVMWDDCRNLGIDEYVLDRLARLTIAEHPTALFLQEFRDQTAQMINTTGDRLRSYNEETARLMQTIAATFQYYAEAATQARGL